MKNKIILTLITLVMLFGNSLQASSAEKLFDSKCLKCHIKTRPLDKSSLIAPPAMGIVRHVTMEYTNKEEAVEFIKSYVLNPQKSKALCQARTIARFGLMPSQKDNLTESELKSIAEWMYDKYTPMIKAMQGGACRK